MNRRAAIWVLMSSTKVKMRLEFQIYWMEVRQFAMGANTGSGLSVLMRKELGQSIYSVPDSRIVWPPTQSMLWNEKKTHQGEWSFILAQCNLCGVHVVRRDACLSILWITIHPWCNNARCDHQSYDHMTVENSSIMALTIIWHQLLWHNKNCLRHWPNLKM